MLRWHFFYFEHFFRPFLALQRINCNYVLSHCRCIPYSVCSSGLLVAVACDCLVVSHTLSAYPTSDQRYPTSDRRKHAHTIASLDDTFNLLSPEPDLEDTAGLHKYHSLHLAPTFTINCNLTLSSSVISICIQVAGIIQ